MSDFDVGGKTAVVTGAGSGIGHAITKRLLQAGCSVVLADIKLRPEAAATIEEYPHPPKESSRASAILKETDVADWGQLQGLWDSAIASFGTIDIVVSVAGIYEPPWSSFWKPPGIAAEALDKKDALVGQYETFAINQIAPIRLAQLAIDHWTQRQIPGNYLAVASIAAYLHSIETPLYMASKAALVSFIKSLGGLRDILGIRVAALCPGPVHTPMFEPEWNRKLDPKDIALTADDCARGGLGVIQEAHWGDGSIVETQKFMVDDKPVVTMRKVELELLYPKPEGRTSSHALVFASRQRLVERVKKHGMRAI